EVKRLSEAVGACYAELRPLLAEEGIHILSWQELTTTQMTAARRYFEEIVFPILTPLAVDFGRPFPHISNLSVNLAVQVKRNHGDKFARVKVPDPLPALVPLTRPGPSATKRSRTRRKEAYAWLEDVIAGNLQALFPGVEIIDAYPFHVTRRAEIEIQQL